MFDHTHVHSCFDILSSFDLRISSFTQAFGFLPIPPGIHRDAGTTQRDRAGLIGTALGPEKEAWFKAGLHSRGPEITTAKLYLLCCAAVTNENDRIVAARSVTLSLPQLNHAEKDGFLSPLADAPGRITTLRTASYVSGPRNHTPPNIFFSRVPPTTLNAQRRSDAIHTLPWGDFREILDTLWQRFGVAFFQPHPSSTSS